MGMKQKLYLLCCIMMLSASNVLGMKRDFTDHYQHENIELQDDDSQDEPGNLENIIMLSLKKINICIDIHLGTSDDDMQFDLPKWTVDPSKMLTASEVLAKKFTFNLIQSFRGKGRTELEKSCNKFDGFAQCSYKVSETMGEIGFPVVDHIVVFLQGVIGFICDDGFNRYHKYFANSGCLNDVIKASSQKCMTVSTEVKFFVAGLTYFRVISLPNSQKIILKHFICLASSYASCIESEIDDACPDSQTADVWVTMFNEGIEKFFAHFSLPYFTPNARSCEAVETQFTIIREMSDEYQDKEIKSQDGVYDFHKGPGIRETFRTCLIQMNTCIGNHFGTTYDQFGTPGGRFSLLGMGFRLLVKNLYFNLKESFLDRVQQADGITQLHKSCSKFDHFIQCHYDVHKSVEDEECPGLDQIMVFLQGVSNYICHDDFNRYYKHFANSDCIDDIISELFTKCFNQTVMSKFLASYLQISLIVTFPTNVDHRETFLKHSVCLASELVSCMHSEIEVTCPETADIWVTMFNKGIQKVFKLFSLHNFIPNPKSCEPVETQFFRLTKSYANKISDTLQENDRMDCSFEGSLHKLGTCLLQEYTQFVLHMANNPNDLSKAVESVCKENIASSLELCLSQYQEVCPKRLEQGIMISELLKDVCELSSVLTHSLCSWTDLTNIRKEWAALEKQQCKKQLSKIFQELKISFFQSNAYDHSRNLKSLIPVLKDDELFQCFFDTGELAVKVLGKKCVQFSTAYVKFFRKFVLKFKHFRLSFLKYINEIL